MRNLVSALVCGFLTLVFFSCEKEKDVPVSSVTISQATAEMLIGETIQLSAKVLPNEASDKTVSWASSKQSAATVSNTGLVTAIAEGISTITASAGGKSGTCTITVSKKVVEVSSVELDKTSAQLKAGETVTLTATVKPVDATDKTVTWSTSDSSVATVDNGVVTAIKVGSATITAKAGDKSATCSISVVPTLVTSVTLDQTNASLRVGETVTLTATVKPDDATDNSVTWSTSDASVATVDNGVVTAKKVGSATITAKVSDKSATCSISVVPTPVTSVTLNKANASLKVGETISLTATVKPDDATDKTVTWETSEASVATITDGVVTAIKLGSATITAKAGDKSAVCAITVIPTPVTSVTLNQPSASLKVGETVTLTATVKPDDATDKTVTWTTSDASVATVDNGMVIAKKVGSATITAKAGSISATCAITIIPTPVTSVTLDQTGATLKVGETITLTATVKPDDATDKTVTWTSSNKYVASVDQNGRITANTGGTATITATSGSFSATCKVTVIVPVENITLNMVSKTIKVNETILLIAVVSPSNATNQTIQWTSSDNSIASVSSDGLVKGLKEGFATITASADNQSATCAITVKRSTAGGNEGIGYDE